MDYSFSIYNAKVYKKYLYNNKNIKKLKVFRQNLQENGQNLQEKGWEL